MAHWGSPNKLVFFDDGTEHNVQMTGQKKNKQSPDLTQLTTALETCSVPAQGSTEMKQRQSPPLSALQSSPMHRRQTFPTPEPFFSPSKRDFQTSLLPMITTRIRVSETPMTAKIAVRTESQTATALGARPKQSYGDMSPGFISPSQYKSRPDERQSYHISMPPASRIITISNTTQCYPEPLVSSGLSRGESLASGFEENWTNIDNLTVIFEANARYSVPRQQAAYYQHATYRNVSGSQDYQPQTYCDVTRLHDNQPQTCRDVTRLHDNQPQTYRDVTRRHEYQPPTYRNVIKPPDYFPCCNFCKRNGETKTVFMSHKLMEHGRIVCPILRKYKCPLCGATGDNAHTVSYCSYGSGESSVTANRTPKKSCGCARSCKHGKSRHH